MIKIIGDELHQWDVGRMVSVTETDATHIHLANAGDSRAPILEIVDGEAKIPDYLLRTGKQVLAFAVKDGVTVESEAFFVQRRPRPENYIYEDDQRNYIYAVIEAVEETVARAERAAEVIESGKFEKTLYTRDVFVGGAKDAYGNWGPRNPNIVDHTPLAEPVKNEMFISTMKIPKAGQHFLILPEGSNYLYKMQITEADNIRVFDVDEMPVIAAGTYSDNYYYDAGNGINVIFSAKTRVDSSTKIFADGFIGNKRLNFQKATAFVDDDTDYPFPAVEFYVFGPAEVTIWWVAGADDRFFAIQSKNHSGPSRMEVSGTFVAHGRAETKDTHTVGHLDVENEAKIGGTLTVEKDIKMRGSLDVGNDMKLAGSLTFTGSDSLDMGGNDIKNAQSISVKGTSNLGGDVKIKNNSNRDYTIKLSGALNEALDYGFKSRVYVDKMPGASFTQKLQNAYEAVVDGGTVVIPYDEATDYVLDSTLILTKSVRLLGTGKIRPVIRFSMEPLFVLSGCARASFEHLDLIGEDGGLTVIRDAAGSGGNLLEMLEISECQIDNQGPLIVMDESGAYDIVIRDSKILGVNDYSNIVTAQMGRMQIATSYLDGGNSSHEGEANIVTNAEYVLLDDCEIVGYDRAIDLGNNTKSITAINCTVDVYGKPKLLGYYENLNASVVAVGGNLGLKFGNSKVVTEDDVKSAGGAGSRELIVDYTFDGTTREYLADIRGYNNIRWEVVIAPVSGTVTASSLVVRLQEYNAETNKSDTVAYHQYSNAIASGAANRKQAIGKIDKVGSITEFLLSGVLLSLSNTSSVSSEVGQTPRAVFRNLPDHVLDAIAIVSTSGDTNFPEGSTVKVWGVKE